MNKWFFLIFIQILGAFSFAGIDSWLALVRPLGSHDSCIWQTYGMATGTNYVTVSVTGYGGLTPLIGPVQGGFFHSVVSVESPFTNFSSPAIIGCQGVFTDNAGITRFMSDEEYLTCPPPIEPVCEPDDQEPNLPGKVRAAAFGEITIGNCSSPIVVDLGRNGFHFGPAGEGVYFDNLGSGDPLLLQWVRKGEDDAFLVLDLNGNGIVDNGSELFGQGTRLRLDENRLAPNGFVGLAQYDRLELGGNDDGFISKEDQIWGKLLLWLDVDADGISTPGEIAHVYEYGLSKMETIPRETRSYDESGNWLRFFARSGSEMGLGHKMVDVFFRVLDPRDP